MDFEKELSVFKKIHFVEESHCYFIDGVPTNDLSVTRLIKKFKREFNKEQAAARIAKKLNTTIQQVLADWEMNRIYSATIGTLLHKYIEGFYVNEIGKPNVNFDLLGFDEKEKIKQNLPIMIKYFHNFCKDNPQFKCIKNEIITDKNDP